MRSLFMPPLGKFQLNLCAFLYPFPTIKKLFTFCLAAPLSAFHFLCSNEKNKYLTYFWVNFISNLRAFFCTHPSKHVEMESDKKKTRNWKNKPLKKMMRWRNARGVGKNGHRSALTLIKQTKNKLKNYGKESLSHCR